MSTGFRSVHPLSAFVYYAGVMLLSMMLLHPFFLAAAVFMMMALNIVQEAKASMVRTLLLFLAAGAFFFLLNPVVSQRGAHVLFEWGDNRVTLEAALYGLTMALSPLAVVFAFLSFNKVLTADKLMYLFAAVWPKGALIVVMAMRFVPLLTRRLRQITQVQRTKGISLAQGPLRSKLDNGMKLLQILLTWSLEDALQTADSMKARGYGAGSRTVYASYRLRLRDRLVLAASCAGIAVCIAFKTMGYGVLTIYPRLEPVGLHGIEAADLAVFVLFLGIPLWIDGKEWLQWRYCK